MAISCFQPSHPKADFQLSVEFTQKASSNVRNWSSSLVFRLAAPSAMLLGIEAAALRSCAVRPNCSRAGKFSSPLYNATTKSIPACQILSFPCGLPSLLTAQSLITQVRAKRSCQPLFSALHRIHRKPNNTGAKPTIPIQRSKARRYVTVPRSDVTTRSPNSHLPIVFPSMP